VPLHPCAPTPSTAMSLGSEAQLRHATPPWRRASTVNHHDHIFPREGHHVTPAQVLIESCTPGRGPQNHETLYHVAVLELMPDEVCVVWVGHLEESLEVVGRRPHLTLVTLHGSRDVPLAGAAHFLVFAIVIVDCSHSPFRTLLVPPLAALCALPSASDSDIGWCLPVAAWGHLLASWRKMKFGRLTASGVLGGAAAQVLGPVPKNVIVFALLRVPHATFRSHACVPLVSLSVS
jgi:hypothetical protein